MITVVFTILVRPILRESKTGVDLAHSRGHGQ